MADSRLVLGLEPADVAGPQVAPADQRRLDELNRAGLLMALQTVGWGRGGGGEEGEEEDQRC